MILVDFNGKLQHNIIMAEQKVYLVFEYDEGDGHGQAEEVFSGYAYWEKEIADKHAANVWGGRVREVTISDKAPNWMGR